MPLKYPFGYVGNSVTDPILTGRCFQRYRASGPSKRFRLGICAPLPPDFLALCVKSGIKVDTVEAKGGLSIDDVFLNEKQIQELDGSWVHADCV